MDTIALKTAIRNTSRKPKVLRRENLVPCVMYGNKAEHTLLQCDHNTLFKAYVQAGESTVIDLEIDGKNTPVLFHAIDFHPVTEKILHADFYAVNMKKVIETMVPLHFIGEAPAVKELGGVLLTVLDHITVQCLPGDLPHAIEVDITSLTNFDEALHISDLIVEKSVTIMDEADQMIATVQQPRAAVEEETSEEVAEAPAEESKEGEGESDK